MDRHFAPLFALPLLALLLPGCLRYLRSEGAGVARAGDISRSHYVWTSRAAEFGRLEPDMRGDTLVLGSHYHREFLRLDPRTGAVVGALDTVRWHRFVMHIEDTTYRSYRAIVRAGTGIVVDTVGSDDSYMSIFDRTGPYTLHTLANVYHLPLPEDFEMRDLHLVDESPYVRGDQFVYSLRFRPRDGGRSVTVQFPRRQMSGPFWYRPFGTSGLLVWYGLVVDRTVAERGLVHEVALIDLRGVYDEARANDLLDPE